MEIKFIILTSEIENLIITWNNDGTKTAGSLTREIMIVLSQKFKNQSKIQKFQKEFKVKPKLLQTKLWLNLDWHNSKLKSQKRINKHANLNLRYCPKNKQTQTSKQRL